MKIFKNKCYNGGSKHKFKPRTTEVEIITGFNTSNVFVSGSELRSLMIKNVYIGDICEWCGKFIKSDVKTT